MKPSVLYVTHRVPWPPDRGDRIRTWHILKFLAARADVDLACLADEAVAPRTLSELQRLTRRLAIVPHTGRTRHLRGAASLLRGRSVTAGFFANNRLSRLIRHWTATTDYSAALSSSSGVARYTLPEVATGCGRVWVDLIDVDSEKWLDYSRAARLPGRLLYRTEGRRLRHLETRLAATAERLLVVSEAERTILQQFCPDAPVSVINNGVDTTYFCPAAAIPDPQDGPTCVFVGVMDYRPNVDAVTWFVKDVWLHLRQRFPTAKFQIVGRSPLPEVRALSRIPGVQVTGAVEDVRPWLHRSQCVVVPLRIARGVQNKVLEAMACGRPVVCSPGPLQALRVEPGLHLLQADTAAEWVQQVGRVLTDRDLATDLGAAANAWVQLHHGWSGRLQPLTELLTEVPRTEPLRANLVR